MKNLLLFSMLIATVTLSAQEFQEISTGAGYNNQSFISLEGGSDVRVANNAWDIAFSIAPQDAGVFINECVGSAVGGLPIQAYYTLSEDFSAQPDSAVFLDFPLTNKENNWNYGAFNEIRTPENPLDFGWGNYNPVTHEVTGNHVFVIRLRNNVFLKLQIQSLINGIYAFRYANLDGSAEVNQTIVKAGHAGKLLAYYSFTMDASVDVEPANGFDLLFCRYFTLLEDPGTGDSIDYLVTGILSGGDVQVVQADGVDPAVVSYDDYAAALSMDPEIIGHDWKEFDLSTFMWSVPDDRVYFVKTANDRVWKIQFVDFEGSSTGTAVFEKTDLGIISAIEDPHSPFSEFSVYPNPATTFIHVLFSMKTDRDNMAVVQLTDALGKIVREYHLGSLQEMNAYTVSVHGLSPGFYYIRLSIGQESMVRKLQILN